MSPLKAFSHKHPIATILGIIFVLFLAVRVIIPVIALLIVIVALFFVSQKVLAKYKRE